MQPFGGRIENLFIQGWRFLFGELYMSVRMVIVVQFVNCTVQPRVPYGAYTKKLAAGIAFLPVTGMLYFSIQYLGSIS